MTLHPFLASNELVFCCAVLALVWGNLPLAPWNRFLRTRLFAPAEEGIYRLSRLPLPALLALCFAWGFGIAALLFVFVRRPVAHIHDEASYLLAADTFARGHWTNPALPPLLRPHFEALHIIVAPSYMSKYPPGQGLMLALGIVLGGDPAVGLWINAGLVCAAALYALLPFVPRRWAVLAALLSALHPCVLKWTQTFWGGNLPLLAGLLLLGAVGRLRVGAPRVRDAVTLAVALSLLANCRPFEGVVAAGIVGLPLLPVLWRGLRVAPRVYLARVFAPAAAVLAVTAALMVSYNVHVTGKPLRMPYAVHEDTYGVVPLFLWQKIKPIPPTLRHDTMRFVNAYTCVYGYWGERDSAINLWRGAGDKIELLARSAFQCFDPSVYWLDTPPRAHPLSDPLVFIPAALLIPGFLLSLARSKVARAAAGGLVLFNVVLLSGTFINPHYGAPVGGLALLTWVQTWRYTRAFRLRRVATLWNRRIGLALSRTVLTLFLISAASCAVFFASPDWDWLIQDRRPVQKVLGRIPGAHLVLVYYGPLNVRASSEWVYNSGDLARARIVWARYLTPPENDRLIHYFAGRTVWLLDVSVRDHPHLRRYDPVLMRALPFPPPRTIDPGMVEKIRRGLPTHAKRLSGIAALPPLEQSAYHRGVAQQSAVHRLLRRVLEIPLSADVGESGSPEY